MAGRSALLLKKWGVGQNPSIGNGLVPGQPRTQAIHGWPGVRGWPGNGGPSTESADGLAFLTEMKTFWVIKYLNIYSTNT